MPRSPDGPAARDESWSGRQPLVSGEEAKRAARMYVQGGWSVRALANKWNVSYNAMHRALTAEGVQFRRPGRQPSATRGPEGKHYA